MAFLKKEYGVNFFVLLVTVCWKLVGLHCFNADNMLRLIGYTIIYLFKKYVAANMAKDTFRLDKTQGKILCQTK